MAQETMNRMPLYAASLQSELMAQTMQFHGALEAGDHHIKIYQGQNSLWAFLTRPGQGGFALRTVYAPGAPFDIHWERQTKTEFQFTADTVTGKFRVRLQLLDTINPLFRTTVTLTPNKDLLLDYWPRDLYPLDENEEMQHTEGEILTAQRGVNAGLIYLTLKKPAFGSLLYFQNLTALNPYFQMTETRPDGVVGGIWPEMGYLPPISKEKPLKAGQEVTISDAYLNWNRFVENAFEDVAVRFLDLLADIYCYLERPPSEYHDWMSRADQTLHDLQTSPKATIKHYGHVYVHPYTDAEYPDSMVQLAVLTPMYAYEKLKQGPADFATVLRKGLPRFFDAEIGTVRRYLPNVGKDKNANEVDSWYLYHPLANLGKLAQEGYEDAKDLFMQSLDFAMRVARHFKYQWPIPVRYPDSGGHQRPA